MALFLILLYFITLYIRPQDWHPIFLGWPVVWIVFAGLMFCIPLYVSSTSRLIKGHIFYLLLLWLVVIAFSNLVHGDTWLARFVTLSYLRYVILFGALIVFLKKPRQLHTVVWFIILLTAILAWQTMDQVRLGIGWAGQPLAWDDGFGGRAQWVGMWDGPNVLCLLFVLVIPFLFQYALPPWSVQVRILALALSALIFQGIRLTQSRGGFLAMGIALLFSIGSRFRTGKAIVVITIAAALLAAVAPGRLQNLDDREGSKSGYNRVELWSAGLTMFKENPVLGVGKGRFYHFARKLTGKRLIAHNSYVENMAETGFVGLWVYVALSFLVLKGLWVVRNNIEDQKELSICLAFLVSVCTYAVMSLFVTTDFDLFYVQLALATAFLASKGEFPRITGREIVQIAGVASLFIASLYVFVRLYL